MKKLLACEHGKEAFLKRRLPSFAIVVVLIFAFIWIVISRSNKIPLTTTPAIPSLENGNNNLEAVSPSPTVFQEELLRTDPLPPLVGEKLSDRWVVVTSIQLPTDDIKLLGRLEKFGWRVVVVGDKSTPANYHAPPGVRFLSYEEATTKLGYNLLTYTRWKAYTVKNIGYLFAIQHGAKMIYDTDDDNHPLDNLKSMLELAGYNGTTKVGSIRSLILNPEIDSDGKSLPFVNTLAHFGQASLWPRGTPLTEISRRVPRTYKGVVNGDPDVDAIFRLTRKDHDTRINLTFDRAPPLIIPQRFFVQSNSQNTLFADEKSLPLLLLPFSKTITWRECDIWRGYIAQAFMWIFGARQAYIAPNAFQFRNEHDFLIDFNEEINVYKFAGRLVDFLSKWHCPTGLDFGACFIQVYKDLFAERLIATRFDVDVAEAWISDLKRMHLQFPRRKIVPDCFATSKIDERKVVFFPIEQPVPMPANPSLNRIIPANVLATNISTRHCSVLQQLVDPLVTQDIATLLVFIAKNEKNAVLSVERLNLLYSPYFARRIFCIAADRFTNRLTSLMVTLVEANSGADCLRHVADFRLETSTYVLLSINSGQTPLALLSPGGIKTVVAFSGTTGADVLAGACDKYSGPSVMMASASMISRLSPTQLLNLCKNDYNEASLSVSRQCDLSENAAILLNCQTLSSANWTPPFCRV